jgi:hypothetical protein
MMAIASSDLMREKLSRHLRPAVMFAALAMMGAGLFATGLIGNLEAQDRTSDNDGIAAKVMSLETLWNQAELAQDIQSLDHLLSDSFLYVDIDGSLLRNKTEFINSVTSRAEHIESIRSEAMLSRVHGDAVIVTGIYQEKGTLKGKPYYHHGRFTDTWVKEGSGWLCASSQATLIK